jgi:beta-phosphoglucomutase-like phosphatase (HAD superfamily)
MKYRAFHYDMDGVLVNSEPLHVAVEKETCQHFGLGIDLDGWDGFKGQTAEAIFSHLHLEHMNKYPDVDIPDVDELIRYKTTAFIERVFEGEIEPIDGAMELVKWTRKKAEMQSLVTSSNYRVKDAIISRFDLQKMFDVSITSHDIRIGKPHPGPYLKSLRDINRRMDEMGRPKIRASESLVFEDSKAGIKSARKAGCAVMAITSAYHSREELAAVDPSPTYIVDGWHEAQDIILAS